MLTCKLCNTILSQKKIRKDGTLECPHCGQIYWKPAVDAALRTEHRRQAAVAARV